MTVRESLIKDAQAVAREPNASSGEIPTVLTFNDDAPSNLPLGIPEGGDEIDEEYVRIVQLSGEGQLWARSVEQLGNDAAVHARWGLRRLL